MSRQITPESVRLDVFKPDNATTTPDFTVPAGEIRSASIPRTVGPLKDQAKFTVDNRDGKYRRGEATITGGDRVEFWARLGPTSRVGVPQAVRDAETDDTAQRRHTGVVRNPEVTVGRSDSTLSFTSEDFVGFVLSNATIEASYVDRQVAGTPEAILESVLEKECPAIDRSRIEPITTTTSVAYNATNVIDAVRQLVARGDVVLTSEGRSLVTTPLTDVVASFDLQPSDRGLPMEFEANGDGMANAIRLDGGDATAVGDGQTEQSGWTTVTKSSRLTYRLDMPKSEVTTIELWTDPRRTASGDNAVVRLQRDVDGTPEGVGNNQLDLARRTLAPPFLAENDYTEFLLPDNDIVNHDPWLIIEADESGDGTGQDIGVSTGGAPTYEALYPYPVSARVKDQESIDEYRRRELQFADDSIHSLTEVSQEARAQLSRRDTLSRTVSFPAFSKRAHELTPGEAIHVESCEAGVVADYVLVKRKDNYESDGNVLKSELTLQDIATL